MKVINILTNPEKILRRASRKEDGSQVLEIREHVVTTDTVLSFQEWKSNFRKFNKNKKGDTWDLLDTFSTESQSTAAPQPDLAPIEQAVEEKNAPSISAPICESCQKPFQPRFASAKNCLDCWKRKQRSPGVTELS